MKASKGVKGESGSAENNLDIEKQSACFVRKRYTGIGICDRYITRIIQIRTHPLPRLNIWSMPRTTTTG